MINYNNPTNILTVPNVKEERYSLDIISRLLEERRIQAFGEVSEDSAQILINQLLYLDSKSNEPIHMYISSPGGSVLHGLAVIDTIGAIKSPVYTTVAGIAASMGFMYTIFGARGHRKALPNASIMCHQVSSGCRGTIADMQRSFDHSKDLNTKLMNMIADRTGLSLTKVKKLCDRDTWMNPAEAVKYGVIDSIVPVEWK